jgi:ribosomal protein S12 methylthiotransferase accessory factor
MQVLVIDTMHPQLAIPAFYTIIPGAHFRERTDVNSVGMFVAKLVAQNNPPRYALKKLEDMNRMLTGKFYLQFYLGTCHLALQDTARALDHFKRALELGPSEQEIPTIYSYMGVCYKEDGKYRRALEILKKAEARDSERTDIYNLMGFCHFKLKQHQEAIACFEKVLALDPTSAIDYANIASNYRELGRKDDAVRYYIMALELDPGIDFARENLEKLKSI